MDSASSASIYKILTDRRNERLSSRTATETSRVEVIPRPSDEETILTGRDCFFSEEVE